MSEQSYIKSIFIKGFKKFREFDMEFNNQMNIFVGENGVCQEFCVNRFNKQHRIAA